MTKKKILSLMLVGAALAFGPSAAFARPLPEDAGDDAGDISFDGGTDIDDGGLSDDDGGNEEENPDDAAINPTKPAKKDSGCSVGHGESSSAAGLMMLGVVGVLVTRRRRPR